MLGLAAGDQGCDAERADLAAVDLVVVAAIGDQATRLAFGWAAAALHGGDRFEQQQQLGAVVAVGAGDRPGERHAAAVGQEVVLGAAAAAVNRARTCRGAPFFAWM